MFRPVSSPRRESLYPQSSAISENDWLILASFWHPVAFEHDVATAPVPARLLDIDLVLYRTSTGICVAHDVCPHRGVQLSLGRIIDDRLVCPMHGLHFDGKGRCTRIPSLGTQENRIPPSFALKTPKVEILYGIVWVCLTGEPRWPLPRWDAFADPALRKLFLPVATWRTSAPRHVENFNDLAHFPWVHTGSFGGSPDEPVPDYAVHETAYGLAFSVPYREGFNRFPDGVPGAYRDVIYRYELTFPFSTLLLVEPKGSDYVLYFVDAVCPVSADETRIFQITTDSTGDPATELWLKDALTINEEDRPLVEGQRPVALPLNIHEEVHMRADRMSIEYRRALATRFGLGALEEPNRDRTSV